MANILITGGCGFIGSHLALAFRRQGHRVTALDNLSRCGSEILRDRIVGAGVEFLFGDIRFREDLARLRGPVDLMIECSAEPSVLAGVQGAEAEYVVQNNLVGALHCFEYARRQACPVIFLSTSRVYPYDAINRQPYREEPTRFIPARAGQGFGPDGIGLEFPLDGVRSLYGATKLAAEIMLQEYSRQYDLPAVINRCGVIAGPWQLGKQDQGVFTYWMVCHHQNRPLTYLGFGGKGKQVRDLLHIDDLVDLLLIQWQQMSGFRGEIFAVGGGPASALSLQETTALCRRITGREVPMAEEPHNRPADMIWFVTDIRPTCQRFGWRPQRPPEIILQDIHQWLAAHPELLHTLFR